MSNSKKSNVIPMPGAKTPLQRVANIDPTQDALDFPFDEVTRCTGDHGAANGDNDDPIVMSPAAEARARFWTERYGFDRLPATYGELMGLSAYVEELEIMSGFDSVPKEALPLYQASALRTQEKMSPEKLKPLQLYIAQDIEALRRYHLENETLRLLGRNYRDYENESDEDWPE